MKIVWLLAVFIMKVTSDKLYTNTYEPSEEDFTFTPTDMSDDSISDKPTMPVEGKMMFPTYERNIHMANYITYAVLVTFVIGTTGNLLSFLVFCRPAFRKSTSGLLFRVLAITDTATLLSFAIPEVIDKFTGGRSFGTDTACQVSTQCSVLSEVKGLGCSCMNRVCAILPALSLHHHGSLW